MALSLTHQDLGKDEGAEKARGMSTLSLHNDVHNIVVHS